MDVIDHSGDERDDKDEEAVDLKLLEGFAREEAGADEDQAKGDEESEPAYYREEELGEVGADQPALIAIVEREG